MNKQSKNICIHVCDDNPVAIEEAIKITKDLLNEEGLAAEIITYKDGNQFTERYKERKDELIILDIEMPGKSGLDILKEFETHCKNNRVILLTAYDNLALQSLTYGPFQIVRKDLMEIDLEKAIRRFLRIRNEQNAQLEIKEDGKHVGWLKNVVARFNNGESLDATFTLTYEVAYKRKGWDASTPTADVMYTRLDVKPEK